MRTYCQQHQNEGRGMITPHIQFTHQPNGLCPVQAHGFINGHPFYFKSRGAHMRLYVAAAPRADVFDVTAWRHYEEYKGVHRKHDDEINDGRVYSAGYAEKEECLDFINRAATKWLAEKGAA